MNEDRKIRFLVSPLLFFVSLAWGFLRDGTRSLDHVLPGLQLKPDELSGLVALLAGGGIAVFTFGYVIGTITYVVLRLAFILASRFGWGSGSHEIFLSNEALPLIWRRIGASGTPDRAAMFLAGTTFDQDVLCMEHKGIHRWIMRRWNAFSVAATSTMGLILSLVVGVFMRIRFSREWWIPVAITCVVLCVTAFVTWRDTMRTLNFQAVRQHRNNG